MIKLSENTYDRIVAQAEEAEYLGFDNISKNIQSSIKEANIFTENDSYSYTRQELAENIKENLWKSAIAIIGYHNIVNADMSHLSKMIENMSEKITEEIEDNLNVKDNIGPNDYLPGIK